MTVKKNKKHLTSSIIITYKLVAIFTVIGILVYIACQSWEGFNFIIR